MSIRNRIGASVRRVVNKIDPPAEPVTSWWTVGAWVIAGLVSEILIVTVVAHHAAIRRLCVAVELALLATKGHQERLERVEAVAHAPVDIDARVNRIVVPLEDRVKDLEYANLHPDVLLGLVEIGNLTRRVDLAEAMLRSPEHAALVAQLIALPSASPATVADRLLGRPPASRDLWGRFWTARSSGTRRRGGNPDRRASAVRSGLLGRWCGSKHLRTGGVAVLDGQGVVRVEATARPGPWMREGKYVHELGSIFWWLASAEESPSYEEIEAAFPDATAENFQAAAQRARELAERIGAYLAQRPGEGTCPHG